MVKSNDASDFETELITLIPSLRAFGRSLCGDFVQGEDLAQEALVKAWSNQHRFEMGTNMKAWTFMILRNLFYSQTRRSWRSAPLDPEVAARTLIAVTGDTDRLELDELRRALSMLSSNHREAIILIGAAGLSYEEAAEITNTPVGTLKSRVSRARDQLALFYAESCIAKDGCEPAEAMTAIFNQIDEYLRAA